MTKAWACADDASSILRWVSYAGILGGSRMGTPVGWRLPASSFGRIAAVDHDGLDLAGAATPERRRLVVFVGGEAGHALLKGGKLDDDETVELVRPFHDLVAAAARQDLAAVPGDDRWHQVGVFLVRDRIVDLRTGNPVGRHRRLLNITAPRFIPRSWRLPQPETKRY